MQRTSRYNTCMESHAPPLELWRQRYPAQLVSLFGAYPLSHASLSRAVRPAGHVGNRFRLARMLRGRIGNVAKNQIDHERKPLRVAVLGDSMTMGHGCFDDKRKREMNGFHPPLDPLGRTWPTRLSELLEGLKFGPVTVDNLAYPSRSDIFLRTHFYSLN